MASLRRFAVTTLLLASGSQAANDPKCRLADHVLSVLHLLPQASSFCSTYLDVCTKTTTRTSLVTSTAAISTVLTFGSLTVTNGPITITSTVTAPITTSDTTTLVTITSVEAQTSTVTLGPDCNEIPNTVHVRNAKRSIPAPLQKFNRGRLLSSGCSCLVSTPTKAVALTRFTTVTSTRTQTVPLTIQYTPTITITTTVTSSPTTTSTSTFTVTVTSTSITATATEGPSYCTTTVDSAGIRLCAPGGNQCLDDTRLDLDWPHGTQWVLRNGRLIISGGNSLDGFHVAVSDPVSGGPIQLTTEPKDVNLHSLHCTGYTPGPLTCFNNVSQQYSWYLDDSQFLYVGLVVPVGNGEVGIRLNDVGRGGA